MQVKIRLNFLEDLTPNLSNEMKQDFNTTKQSIEQIFSEQFENMQTKFELFEDIVSKNNKNMLEINQIYWYFQVNITESQVKLQKSQSSTRITIIYNDLLFVKKEFRNSWSFLRYLRKF